MNIVGDIKKVCSQVILLPVDVVKFGYRMVSGGVSDYRRAFSSESEKLCTSVNNKFGLVVSVDSQKQLNELIEYVGKNKNSASNTLILKLSITIDNSNVGQFKDLLSNFTNLKKLELSSCIYCDSQTFEHEKLESFNILGIEPHENAKLNFNFLSLKTCEVGFITSAVNNEETGVCLNFPKIEKFSLGEIINTHAVLAGFDSGMQQNLEDQVKSCKIYGNGSIKVGLANPSDK